MKQPEIRVLGPVRIAVDDNVAAIPSVRARTVLAVLALRHNSVVSVDELIDVAWGDAAPRTAANQLQIAVFRLRQALAAGGVDAHSALVTHPTGYQLNTTAVAVDLAEFRTARRAAEEAARAQDWAGAAGLFERALGLWRGAVCQDVAAPGIASATEVLEQERREAAERLLAVELLLDRPIAGRAAQLIEQDPLRERLWHLLVLGQARGGRPGVALEEYQRARRTLAAELGLEPGAQLRQLEQDVLRGRIDSAVDVVRGWFRPAPASAPPAESRPSAVWQLPADIPDFTGRDAEIREISALLRGDGDHAPIVCVAGMGGMGKTTLAIRAARGLRDRFPDGAVFFDLRGADPQPPDAHQVSGWILRTLGLPATAIPDEPQERTGRLRAELAGRRLLLLMDNAADERQIRPLVPPDGGSALLVTGRRMLAGLDGARLLDLDVLPAEDGLRLLAELAGGDRVAVDPAGAQRLVDLCGGLPLAVRIAGVRLARRASTSVGWLAERLADEQSRLDELAAGDREVRSVFAVSHGRLEPTAAALLRRLALLPVPEAPAWVAAALLDVSAAAAERVAWQLVDASLLTERDAAGGGRYRLHDLVQLYAREQADDGADAEALRRVYEALLGAAGRAAAHLPMQAFPTRPADPAGTKEGYSAQGSGVVWFEAHERLLLGAAADAGRRGWVTLAAGIVTAMTNYVSLRPYAADWELVGAELVERLDPADQVRPDLLLALGMRAQSRGRFDVAVATLRQARRVYVAQGDADRAAVAAGQCGVIHRRRGRHRLATAVHEWALARLSGRRFPAQLGRLLLSRGNHILESYGDPATGYAILTQARECARAGGDLEAEVNILGTMGLLMRRESRLAEARALFEEGEGIARRIGVRSAEGMMLTYLTRVLVDLKDLTGAQKAAARALAAAQESELPVLMRDAHSASGSAALARGDLGRAAEHALEAVRLSARTGVLGRAGSLFLLSRVRLALGDEEAADAHAEEARAIYADLNRPEADLIAAWRSSWLE